MEKVALEVVCAAEEEVEWELLKTVQRYQEVCSLQQKKSAPQRAEVAAHWLFEGTTVLKMQLIGNHCSVSYRLE